MSTTVRAMAALSQEAPLRSYEFEVGPLGRKEVEIAVEYCGVCHSDVSMVNNEWGFSAYPLVPGHEAVGIVSAVGDDVKAHKVGDRVGLGWHCGYCNECGTCKAQDQNMCAQARPTIAGHHGGFAEKVRCDEEAAVRVPDAMNPATAGPLLCGGITVWTPMVEYGVTATSKVGVIGIGGLGHIAIKMLSKFGCQVTAFTSSESKMEEAKALGAHNVVNNRKPEEIQAVAGTLDMVLVCVANVTLDWEAYLTTLQPRGRLHFVGIVPPVEVKVPSLVMQMKQISGSPTGSPKNIAAMLEFCARNGVEPQCEEFALEDAEAAFKKIHDGTIRYRAVLKVSPQTWAEKVPARA